jgi:tRNA-splicing ligase RtcB
MPDAHCGYGFPIGGVAAFDPDESGIVSAGGVGFDISCGVRTILTGLRRGDVEPVKKELADSLFANIPAGLGSRGKITLDVMDMDAMLLGGARWAQQQGYGVPADLERIEEHGTMEGPEPDAVSTHAKERQRAEMGTLGSGNHYLEVQEVVTIHDEAAASAFGLKRGDVVVSIHCGSRGLGHQIGTEFLREMAIAAPTHGIHLPDLELACAPIRSELGRRYLGAMRAAINCALANRQIITHLTRRVFAHHFPDASLDLLFDVSHNTCKEEWHDVDGVRRQLYIHRKGATRAFGPGHPDLPSAFAAVGQPVFIGGSMGTMSAIMVGAAAKPEPAFASACHGAGRRLSRHQALKRWHGRQVINELAHRGIIIRSPSTRGVAEEAPGAYKDTAAVVEAAHATGLARKVADLSPIICIKG